MKDLIYRQDAIDGFYEMASDIDHLCTVSDYVSFLESLPSARPEITVDGYADGFADGYKRGLTDAQSETANIIVGKSRNGMTMWYQCDNCNEPVDENDLYCRGCGRRFEHGSDR